MFDALDLQSSCARKSLLNSEMMVKAEDIRSYYSKLGRSYDKLYGGGGTINGVSVATVLAHLKDKLKMVRDIHSTLERLSDGASLDDIELFEIKFLAFLSRDVRESVDKIEFDVIEIPLLDSVISILDPDGLNIRTFYVYDSYSVKLAEIRAQLKLGEEKLGQEMFLSLLEQAADEESAVREKLCEKLRADSEKISTLLCRLAELDILLAKTEQIKELNLSIPKISCNGVTSYRGMFHPQIKAALEDKGKPFIPIDIQFGMEPVTIIGANMGGKTVVLKMLALNQLLFQFGFGIPALSAEIDIKDNVFFCIGDDQNIVTGLSSFAAEMKQIDGVLNYIFDGEVKKGHNGKILALIDEPARTTNPIEGKALVESLVDILSGESLSVLLTTHYNIDCENVKKMRVIGLVDGVMDYRLIETQSGDIPHEAINIARSMNINERWVRRAEERLGKNDEN